VQWNINGISRKLASLIALIIPDSPHVICIQESLCREPAAGGSSPFQLQGYKAYFLYATTGESSTRGLITYIRRDIPALKVSHLYNLGSAVESLSVTIRYGVKSTTIHNVYSHCVSGRLDLHQLASKPSYVLAGDFNAQHPLWSSHRVDAAGSRVLKEVEALNCVVLNDGSPTRATPTAPDITMVSPDLAQNFTWSVELGTPSDHGIIRITLAEASIPEAAAPPRRLCYRKADWAAFGGEVTRRLQEEDLNSLPTVHDHERALTRIITTAAERTIPLSKPRESARPR
jgi:hypothetical protein